MSNLGAKFDGGKLCFSLLTRGLAKPLKSIAAVLTYGKAKYEADSWKDVPDAKRRYEDALDRHLNAWKSGELHDDESGLHHLAHIACNVLFLMWLEMQRVTPPQEMRDNWFKPNDPNDTGTMSYSETMEHKRKTDKGSYIHLQRSLKTGEVTGETINE